jgi:hypothetical protein
MVSTRTGEESNQGSREPGKSNLPSATQTGRAARSSTAPAHSYKRMRPFFEQILNTCDDGAQWREGEGIITSTGQALPTVQAARKYIQWCDDEGGSPDSWQP